MAVIVDSKGVDKAIKKLRLKARKENREDVIVAYTQNYAMHVHENLGAYHHVGQAKFLEKPFRELGRELVRLIASVYKQRGSLTDALVYAGLRLQRESQLLTPVDTGALKASAYTAKESNAQAAAGRAWAESEQKKHGADPYR